MIPGKAPAACISPRSRTARPRIDTPLLAFSASRMTDPVVRASQESSAWGGREFTPPFKGGLLNHCGVDGRMERWVCLEHGDGLPGPTATTSAGQRSLRGFIEVSSHS